MSFERLKSEEYKNVYKTLENSRNENIKPNLFVKFETTSKEIYNWFNEFAEMKNIIDDPKKIKIVNYKGEKLNLMMFISKKEKELLKSNC